MIRLECGSKASDSCKANLYNSFSFPLCIDGTLGTNDLTVKVYKVNLDCPRSVLACLSLHNI